MSPNVFLLLLSSFNPACSYHHQGNLLITSASDIPKCLETVNGDVDIRLTDTEVVFEQLTDITGHLTIRLKDAKVGLPELERVHQTFDFISRRSDSSDSLVLGFDRLTYVGGSIGLDFSESSEVSGFKHMRRHEGGLWVSGGGKMRDLFPNLSSISGTLLVRPTSSVQGLFENLTIIGGHFVISNSEFELFDGFGNLEMVLSDLYVLGSSNLKFPRLNQVRGTLSIKGSQIKSLESLGRKNDLQVGGLVLVNNPCAIVCA